MDTLKYDLIVLPVAGSFGGTSGLFALKEKFEFTKGAFSEMWGKLNKDKANSQGSSMDTNA